MYQEFNRKFADWVAAAGKSRTGVYIVGCWAIAEATFWFIAPDFILGILIAFAPFAWKKLLYAALLGSLIGGIVSFSLNLAFPVWMSEVLSITPFVQPHMIAFVDDLYTRHQYYGVLFQSFSFMQFKIWTQLAVHHGLHPLFYFTLVMISRAIRFGLVTRLAKEIGSRVSAALLPHAIIFTMLYTILFFTLLVILES